MNYLKDSSKQRKSVAGLLLVKEHSSRLPGKNTMDFGGKPMFLWNTEKCLGIFEKVYVSTDSEKIADMAKQVGALPIMRGAELGGECPNVTVYHHAISSIKEDAFVAVHANNPLLDCALIKMAKAVILTGSEEVMTCHPMTHGSVYKDQHNKIYGSVWGMTKDRIRNYPDPYRPNPDVLLVDDSIEIETKDDYDLCVAQL
jgi:CMP-N-acetylneuraminic acid synthetase